MFWFALVRSRLGFSQQTNYPIVFEAAYVTAQLLLQIASELPALKLTRNEPAIYVEDPATPERPLDEADAPKVLGHVCPYQCPMVAKESALQAAHAAKRQRKQKREEERARRREANRRVRGNPYGPQELSFWQSSSSHIAAPTPQVRLFSFNSNGGAARRPLNLFSDSDSSSSEEEF